MKDEYNAHLGNLIDTIYTYNETYFLRSNNPPTPDFFIDISKDFLSYALNTLYPFYQKLAEIDTDNSIPRKEKHNRKKSVRSQIKRQLGSSLKLEVLGSIFDVILNNSDHPLRQYASQAQKNPKAQALREALGIQAKNYIQAAENGRLIDKNHISWETQEINTLTGDKITIDKDILLLDLFISRGDEDTVKELVMYGADITHLEQRLQEAEQKGYQRFSTTDNVREYIDKKAYDIYDDYNLNIVEDFIKEFKADPKNMHAFPILSDTQLQEIIRVATNNTITRTADETDPRALNEKFSQILIAMFEKHITVTGEQKEAITNVCIKNSFFRKDDTNISVRTMVANFIGTLNPVFIAIMRNSSGTDYSLLGDPIDYSLLGDPISQETDAIGNFITHVKSTPNPQIPTLVGELIKTIINTVQPNSMAGDPKTYNQARGEALISAFEKHTTVTPSQKQAINAFFDTSKTLDTNTITKGLKSVFVNIIQAIPGLDKVLSQSAQWRKFKAPHEISNLATNVLQPEKPSISPNKPSSSKGGKPRNSGSSFSFK